MKLLLCVFFFLCLPFAYADSAMRDLVGWLECEDCERPPPQKVTRHGNALVAVLKSIIEQGPSPARRERLARALQSGYEQHAQSVRDKSQIKPRWSKEQYVEHYIGVFDNAYRIRAVQALAAIGSPEARKALEAASEVAVHPKVKREMQRSLQELR